MYIFKRSKNKTPTFLNVFSDSFTPFKKVYFFKRLYLKHHNKQKINVFDRTSDTTEISFHINFEVVISTTLGPSKTFEFIKQLLNI